MTRPVSALLPNADWPLTQPFWSATARHELRFPRCLNCGQHQWYPRVLCRVCRSADFSWDLVDPQGAVYTYTVVRRPMVKGSEGSVPFAVLQLNFDEAPGVTFVTNLADESQCDRLAIGARVGLTFHQVDDRLHMPFAVLA